MMWQDKEKRWFPRVDYPCTVSILSLEQQETFPTYTQNIGIRGVCVILPKEFPKFCLVKILLYLKDGRNPMTCKGKIVWQSRRDHSSGREFYTGIEFIDITQDDRLRIDQIVQDFLDKL